MNNFYCYNPTKILFGKGMIARIGAELTGVRRVLLLSGGGSGRRNGALEQTVAALGDLAYVEFAGIAPNPEYETCRAAIATAREHDVDFVLAVGGGSVIDAAKFIALAYHDESDDPWQLLSGAPAPPRVLPLGCVQTLPATGSELNNAFVLSRRALRQKLSYSAPVLFPRFSVLDPELTLSLPPRQTALGLVDMFVHVLEQYVTYPAAAPLQDRQAEAILATVAETAAALLRDPDDYELRATTMWCGAQAVSGLINRGVPTDWATHAIGHELTALYDLPHAQTLALVLGGVYRHCLAAKRDKLAQYGRRIWGLAGDDASVAVAAIARTEAFFESLGVATRLGAVGLAAPAVAAAVREQWRVRPFSPLGERRDIDLDAVAAILLAQA